MSGERFGRLLKGAINSIAAYEGKTAPVVEEELGNLIGVSGATIQRYKSGALPPEIRTIEILAEAGVNRAYLNREWLLNFLKAAHYPAPDKLLNRLTPASPSHKISERIYQNLPAPTYSRFVMRKEPFDQILDGLEQRSAVVLLTSLGGMGKTSLAREVADHCLRAEGPGPKFEAAVWISDKDRPGTTNLGNVLDELARTLDYPGYTQLEHEEKRREVENLLRSQKVLLVVDNFETVTDSNLLSWLLRLPEPSKALITSREYSRAFRNSTVVVDLRGMSEAEAQELINNRLRLLRMEKLVTTEGEITPLVAATGGNPKALEMALGYIKYQHQPLQQVVDDLYEARGELFDDLFTRVWSLLDEAARRILLSSTFFLDSASREALAATADVRGFVFDLAMDRLTDLALLDAQQENINSRSRYLLHPLVRAYATSKLAEYGSFEAGARERWLQFFYHFAKRSQEEGWDGYSIFDRVELEAANLHAVMDFCYSTGRGDLLIELVLIFRPFWSTRGYFEIREKYFELAKRAAQQKGDIALQIQFLSFQARVFCYKNDATAAAECCHKARELLNSLNNPDPLLITNINFSQARVCRISGDYEQMLALSKESIAIFKALKGEQAVPGSYDFGEYLYQVGRYREAEELFLELNRQCAESGYLRAPITGWVFLARIALKTGRLDQAKTYLKIAEERALELKHRRFLAEIQLVKGNLFFLEGDKIAAYDMIKESLALFERLGIRNKFVEVKEELRKLEESGNVR